MTRIKRTLPNYFGLQDFLFSLAIFALFRIQATPQGRAGIAQAQALMDYFAWTQLIYPIRYNYTIEI